LRHPHVISVLDYGFDRLRQPYFTMNLLEDTLPLTDAGHDQPLDIQITYLTQTLQALAYLHRRGILHRDLKPGNVLIANGRAYVLDFGLSVEREAAQGRVGTVAYMAPEILLTEQAGETSDLYAVGVLAYQTLTGRHPFDTNSFRLVMDILEKEPDLSPLPKTVAPIVGKLLAKEPTARYQNVQQVIEALNTAIDPPPPTESAAIRDSFLQAARFVGRDAELSQLTTALSHATAGRGGVWLVGGESGVGKSRLLDELRTHALVSGAMVVRGQAVEGGGLPYQLWRGPLRRLALIAGLSDLEAGVIKPLIPDVETLLGRKIPDALTLPGEAAQQRLHFTIAEICRTAAQTAPPLVLLLEDLHWTDESLEPLKVLLRLIADLPLLAIGSYRSEESPSLPLLLPDAHVLPVERLRPEHIAELSASMLGGVGKEPSVLKLLQKETEGNAFFLVETVNALAEKAGRLDAVGQTPLPEYILPVGCSASSGNDWNGFRSKIAPCSNWRLWLDAPWTWTCCKALCRKPIWIAG
jgi:hypothetical protein